MRPSPGDLEPVAIRCWSGSTAPPQFHKNESELSEGAALVRSEPAATFSPSSAVPLKTQGSADYSQNCNPHRRVAT